MAKSHLGKNLPAHNEAAQVDLCLSELRRANLARLPSYRNKKGDLCHPPVPGLPPGYDWTLSQWCNATSGELGETANLAKKIERGDFTLEEARGELADELCDVLTYLDLLAHRAGIDLSAATLKKWNEVSDRVGSEARLHPAGISPVNVQGGSEWVAMSDRTPEMEGVYLAWKPNPAVSIGDGIGSCHMMKWSQSEKAWFHLGVFLPIRLVTHWAPRPSGPTARGATLEHEGEESG